VTSAKPESPCLPVLQLDRSEARNAVDELNYPPSSGNSYTHDLRRYQFVAKAMALGESAGFAWDASGR
jgi:hypothetical protein